MNNIYKYGLTTPKDLKELSIERLNSLQVLYDNTYKSHKLNDLLELCGLTQNLEEEKTNSDFYTAWSIISNWNVAIRYRCTGNNASDGAESCIKCLKEGGVFDWIQSKWQL